MSLKKKAITNTGGRSVEEHMKKNNYSYTYYFWDSQNQLTWRRSEVIHNARALVSIDLYVCNSSYHGKWQANINTVTIASWWYAVPYDTNVLWCRHQRGNIGEILRSTPLFEKSTTKWLIKAYKYCSHFQQHHRNAMVATISTEKKSWGVRIAATGQPTPEYFTRWHISSSISTAPGTGPQAFSLVSPRFWNRIHWDPGVKDLIHHLIHLARNICPVFVILLSDSFSNQGMFVSMAARVTNCFSTYRLKSLEANTEEAKKKRDMERYSIERGEKGNGESVREWRRARQTGWEAKAFACCLSLEWLHLCGKVGLW